MPKDVAQHVAGHYDERNAQDRAGSHEPKHISENHPLDSPSFCPVIRPTPRKSSSLKAVEVVTRLVAKGMRRRRAPDTLPSCVRSRIPSSFSLSP